MTRQLTGDRTRRVVDDFGASGFAVVPSVVDRADVAAMRALCDELLAGSSELLPSELLRHPLLADVPLREAVRDTLVALFGGSYVLYPNLTVRREVFVGWHVDDAFAGAGKQYVWSPGFTHLQGAIYLQDNGGEDAGGAIDVLPGSHLVSFDRRGTAVPDYQGTERGVTVRAAAGDLVLWHARTVHRSTPRRAEHVPPAKYGIFFSVGRLDEYENNRFVTHLASKRFVRRGDRTVAIARHIDTARLTYPESYAPDWVHRLERSGGSVYSLCGSAL